MQRWLRRSLLLTVGLVASPDWAADIPVAAPKLSLIARYKHYVVLDEIVFVAKDRGVTKGAGVDPNAIGVTFDVEYGKWHGKGRWIVPGGSLWSANDATGALFFDPDAGEFNHQVRKTVIKPGRSLKLIAWSFDYQDIRPDVVGPPNGPVYTAYCVTNGAETSCHCTEFPTCTYAHTGGYLHELARVRCKHGVGDPTCRARCSNVVDQGATMLDACSHLEWEKKDTAIDSGVDAANPHDVDNTYSWAGRCSLDASVLCQPSSAAAAFCAAQTGGAIGCTECGPGQGTCDASVGGGITTVWDWLDGLNASGFGGHSDWRIPTDGTGAAVGSPVDGTPAELKSLADQRCSGDWCAGAALGPSKDGNGYWTSTGDGDRAVTNFVGGSGVPAVVWVDQAQYSSKDGAAGVRAVRSAP